MTNITLLHPGAMGAVIGAAAVRAGARVFWIPAGRSDATRVRAEEAGLEACPTLADALRRSDVALSVCPTQAAEEIFQQIVEQQFTGVFVEANAMSPQRMARIAGRAPSECRVVDGSIFGPGATHRRVACLYLSGDSVGIDILRSSFRNSEVEVKPLDGPIGTASALKMAFINFQRSARVLAALSHAVAQHHQVVDALLTEAEGMTSKILANPDYLPVLAARAWRWEAEMREVGDTLREASLPDGLAEDTAEIMSAWKSDRDNPDVTITQVLDSLHIKPSRA